MDNNIRNCIQCDIIFNPNNKRQIFCNKKCANKHRREINPQYYKNKRIEFLKRNPGYASRKSMEWQYANIEKKREIGRKSGLKYYYKKKAEKLLSNKKKD